MADDNKFNDDEKKKGGEFRVPPRTWVVWIAIIGGLIGLMMMKERVGTPGEMLTQYEFFQKFDTNLIASATVNYGTPTALLDITGKYYATDKDGNRLKDKETGADKEVAFRTKARLTEKMEDKLLSYPNVQAKEPNTMLWNLGYQLLFFLGIGLLLWFFFIRQIKMAGKGALSFGKSKARLLAKERNKTTFKDVAGVDEAIEEVSKLVEFLKDPKKFQRLGGGISKRG